MKTIKAIYAFSGDPITLGHIHIIERTAKIFQEVIVGIGINPAKKYLFSLEERVELAKTALIKYKNVKVIAFRGLLVDYAFENDIPVIIRGLRNSEDFNVELMLHQIGESQQMNLETIFFPSSQNMSHISSGAAKALQLEQGFVLEYVPLNVKQKLEEKLSGQFIIGVTGEIASGKSFVCNKLVELGQKAQLPVHTIDIDKIAHQILESLSEPLYHELRETIVKKFGDEVKNENGYINTKALGKLIFNDREKLSELNRIIYKPLLLRLRRELYGRKGLIFIESALIAESDMANLCNNNILLVSTEKKAQINRLQGREYSQEQIMQRMNSQYSYEMKLNYLQEIISKNSYGKIYHYNNNNETADNSALQNLFNRIIEDLMPVALSV